MATKIKLKRMGSKKNAFYRVVVADSRSARDGKVIEFLGTYDPHKNPPEIKINMDKLDKWLEDGATPTEKMNIIIKKARKTPEVQ